MSVASTSVFCSARLAAPSWSSAPKTCASVDAGVRVVGFDGDGAVGPALGRHLDRVVDTRGGQRAHVSRPSGTSSVVSRNCTKSSTMRSWFLRVV